MNHQYGTCKLQIKEVEELLRLNKEGLGEDERTFLRIGGQIDQLLRQALSRNIWQGIESYLLLYGTMFFLYRNNAMRFYWTAPRWRCGTATSSWSCGRGYGRR